MKVTALYSVWRFLKSSEVVIVDPSAEIVTMPNWPCALCAGKYEKAMPPDHTGAMSELKRATASVQRRGGDVMQPYSLK